MCRVRDTDAADRVLTAWRARYDIALGYESWAEYATAEFGEQTQSLAAPIHRELVGYLSAEGMSTRAIAPAVGTGQTQVRRDLSHKGSPTPEPEPVPSGATLATQEGVIITEHRHVGLATGETFNLDTGELTEPSPTPTPARDGEGLEEGVSSWCWSGR